MTTEPQDQNQKPSVSAKTCCACPMLSFMGHVFVFVGYPIVAVMFLLEKGPRDLWARIKSEEGRQTAKEWGESLIVAAVIAFGIIRPFFAQPFKIPSGSMRMTLIEGDRLFVNKLQYGPLVPFTQYRLPGFTKPKRGDVIVFRYPVTRDKDFIKRLIAFGGETIEIKSGRVYINGKPIVEGPIANIHYYNMGDYAMAGMRITVPKGQLFVMGDNSASSHDSRFWGFVPEELLIGKADCIFWPLDRMRWIK